MITIFCGQKNQIMMIINVEFGYQKQSNRICLNNTIQYSIILEQEDKKKKSDRLSLVQCYQHFVKKLQHVVTHVDKFN